MNENKCQHENFECSASIGRLSRDGGGPITGYTADIKVKCLDCGLPFRFVGQRLLHRACSSRSARIWDR